MRYFLSSVLLLNVYGQRKSLLLVTSNFVTSSFCKSKHMIGYSNSYLVKVEKKYNYVHLFNESKLSSLPDM